MNILVTGSEGMIGSALVKDLLDAGHTVIGLDRKNTGHVAEKYIRYQADLEDQALLNRVMDCHEVDRVIHLAALAHTHGEKDLSWDNYYRINTICSQKVFAAAGDRPVLFVSTVDVYGFTKGTVNTMTVPEPVSFYGKSKLLAEEVCRKLKSFDIFRFAPVYTENVKRDIQKRYYLKYPNLAYQIGKGQEYEVLNVSRAVNAMMDWCNCSPANSVRIIRDPVCLKTIEMIRKERMAGRAGIVLHLPAWAVKCGYRMMVALTGKNKYTYLLNKAVYPLRTTDA